MGKVPRLRVGLSKHATFHQPCAVQLGSWLKVGGPSALLSSGSTISVTTRQFKRREALPLYQEKEFVNVSVSRCGWSANC